MTNYIYDIQAQQQYTLPALGVLTRRQLSLVEYPHDHTLTFFFLEMFWWAFQETCHFVVSRLYRSGVQSFMLSDLIIFEFDPSIWGEVRVLSVRS